MKAKRKPAAKKRLKAKRDRKTANGFFSRDEGVRRDQIAAAVAATPYSFGRNVFCMPAILSVVLNIESPTRLD